MGEIFRLGDLLALDRPEGGHEPALPPRRMPLFFAELMKYVPVSQTARCIAFAILTSARNATAREATWDEIQKDENGHYLHVIPRERMKVKSEKIPFDRKTPLSAQAVAILKGAPRFEGDEKGFIFPNINKGKLSAFSRDSFRAFLKRMHVKQKKVDGIGWIRIRRQGTVSLASSRCTVLRARLSILGRRTRRAMGTSRSLAIFERAAWIIATSPISAPTIASRRWAICERSTTPGENFVGVK